MRMGMPGVPRMGASMGRRLRRDGHARVVFDAPSEAVKALVAEGATVPQHSTYYRRDSALPTSLWTVATPAIASI